MQCLCYKMSFICIRMKNHFHICSGFALHLTLKQRLEATRKWPGLLEMTEFFCFVFIINNKLFVCFIVLQANLEMRKAQAVILQVLGEKLQVQAKEFSMTKVETCVSLCVIKFTKRSYLKNLLWGQSEVIVASKEVKTITGTTGYPGSFIAPQY